MKGKLLSIFLVVAVVVSLCLVTVVPVAANDTWDVTITAESNGNPLYDVLINYSYNGSAGYDTTPLTLSDVPNNTELNLHAPLIHVENSKVYRIAGWEGHGELENQISFIVTNDSIETVYYEEYENFVTGGGSLDLGGSKKPEYTFGGVVGVSEPFGIAGDFTIVDHTGSQAETWQCTSGDFWWLYFEDCSVEQTGAETPDASNDCVRIQGYFTSNRGLDELLIKIVIWDKKEPGNGLDTIEVYYWDVSITAFSMWFNGSIIGISGNFQVHNS